MKVLIISHTVISQTGNMGKTLLRYFKDFHIAELAQFYIHSEVPTDNSVCQNYYRFTDKDALRALVSHQWYGKRFGSKDIQLSRATTRTEDGFQREIYQLGRNRTGGIYFARNILWKLTHWFTDDLKNWITAFSPDVVFFASGDYAFMYHIAVSIADYAKVPLVTSCMDDYYLFNKNNDLLGCFQHKLYMKVVKQTMARSSLICCICDLMAERYAELFKKPTRVLYTSAAKRELLLNSNATQISYIGNLGCGRYEQIISIGRTLKKLHLTAPDIPDAIDVYSGERKQCVLAQLTPENGIRFHGSISANEVLSVMSNSKVVIHTESFDKTERRRVRFSVSTKIAESLMSAPCLLAYGPAEVASISYLQKYKAAYIISSPEQLGAGLTEILENTKLRQEIIENSRILATKNHTEKVNSVKLRTWLQDVIDETF